MKRYRTRRIIARTPHSRVYLAEDEQGRQVALKELLFAEVPDTSAIAAFEREAAVLGQLQHPAIPKLVETFQEGRGPGLRLYIVQELVEGQTLLERLQSGPVSDEEAWEIAHDVLDVLEYLHGQPRPVFHRDVKPQNLIRRPSQQLALVDFGTARETHAAGTHGATMVGTFGYMPFEQLGGSVNASSDLYALGATLVHALSGKSPAGLFRPDGSLAFEEEIESPRWRNWLKKLVARNPADRFASAAEARESLVRGFEVAANGVSRTRGYAKMALAIAGSALLLVGGWSVTSHLHRDENDGSSHPSDGVTVSDGRSLGLNVVYVVNDLLVSVRGGEITRTEDKVVLSLPYEVNKRDDLAAIHLAVLPSVETAQGRRLEQERPSGKSAALARGPKSRGTLTFVADPSELPLKLVTPGGRTITIDFTEQAPPPRRHRNGGRARNNSN